MPLRHVQSFEESSRGHTDRPFYDVERDSHLLGQPNQIRQWGCHIDLDNAPPHAQVLKKLKQIYDESWNAWKKRTAGKMSRTTWGLIIKLPKGTGDDSIIKFRLLV